MACYPEGTGRYPLVAARKGRGRTCYPLSALGTAWMAARALPRARRLEQRVDERRRRLARHHEQDHEPEDQDEGHDPVDLVLLGELDDLAEQRAEVAEPAHDVFSYLVELVILAPVALLLESGLRLLVEQERAEHQVVHLRPHEAAVGVLRGADDRLAAYVEAGVYDHSVAGQLLEL